MRKLEGPLLSAISMVDICQDIGVPAVKKVLDFSSGESRNPLLTQAPGITFIFCGSSDIFAENSI
jgi:hypothetical protein